MKTQSLEEIDTTRGGRRAFPLGNYFRPFLAGTLIRVKRSVVHSSRGLLFGCDEGGTAPHRAELGVKPYQKEVARPIALLRHDLFPRDLRADESYAREYQRKTAGRKAAALRGAVLVPHRPARSLLSRSLFW